MGRGVRYLVIPLVLVTACSDSAAETTTTGLPTTVTTPSTTTSTSTTAPSTTTTTTLAEEIPYPDTTGDDWLKIAQEIENFYAWINENPQADLVDHIAVPGTDVHARLRGAILEYEKNGWHERPGARIDVRNVDLQEGGTDTETVLVVLSDFDGSVTLDSDGSIVRETADKPPTFWLWRLGYDSANGWRLKQVDGLQVAEGVDE